MYYSNSAYGELLSSVVTLIIALVFYIIYAFGVKAVMEKKGMGNTYRAFVPVWNSYIAGEILEDELRGDSFIFPNCTRWILALGFLVEFIPFVGGVALIVFDIYNIILMAKLGGKYGTTVANVLFSICGLTGLGYLITAKRMSNSYYGGDSSSSSPASGSTVVDFEVVTEDREGPIVAKPETKGTIIAKPDSKKAEDPEVVFVAPKADDIEVEDSEAVSDDGEIKEFEIPMNESASNVKTVEFEEE